MKKKKNLQPQPSDSGGFEGRGGERHGSQCHGVCCLSIHSPGPPWLAPLLDSSIPTP